MKHSQNYTYDIHGKLHQMSGESTIHHVKTDLELAEILKTPFQHPILISSDSQLGQHLCHDEPITNIGDLLGRYCPSATISVQNLSEAKIEAETWKVSDVESCLAENVSQRKHIINCLDLRPPATCENASVPGSLSRLDLLRKSIPHASHTGRGRSIEGKAFAEFYILSAAGSASAPHADSDGLCTWVRVIQGSKLWFWSQQLSKRTKMDTSVIDKTMLMSPPPAWSSIHLKAGDTFLMPPGLQHAVYTPEDSLCVGGFVLPRSQMINSMRIWAILWLHGDLTNDDLSWSILNLYSTLLGETSSIMMDPDERAHLYQAAIHLDGILMEKIEPSQFRACLTEKTSWKSAIKRFHTTVKAVACLGQENKGQTMVVPLKRAKSNGQAGVPCSNKKARR